MEDTSLDEFFESDGEDGTDPEGSDHGTATDGDEKDVSATGEDEPVGSVSDVEPAKTTAQWSPSGDDCERCRTETSRLWMDDRSLVCLDCKNW